MRVWFIFLFYCIMKRKFKQWWLSIPPIWTKRTMTSHLNWTHRIQTKEEKDHDIYSFIWQNFLFLFLYFLRSWLYIWVFLLQLLLFSFTTFIFSSFLHELLMIYSCCFILNKLNIRFYSTDAISYNILNYQSKLPIQIVLMKKYALFSSGWNCC
jgi:hypothetical protein